MVLYRHLCQCGADRDDRIALHAAGREISYAAFVAIVDAMVEKLTCSGIGPGIAFAAQCDNRPEMLSFYFAASRLGAVFIPVNQSLGSGEVGYIVEHGGAHFIVHDTAHAATVEKVPAVRRLPLDKLGHGVDAPVPAVEDRRPDDFLIIYTSGSTGQPKAVVFDQNAELAGNAALIELWGLKPDDRILVTLPLGYLYGLSTAAVTGLQAGAGVVIHERFSPTSVLGSLIDDGITVYHGVPTMFSMLLSYAEKNSIRADLSGVRKLITAGAPLNRTLRTRFEDRFNVALEDYYALTEARPVFGRFTGDPGPVPEGAIGKAAPDTRVRVVDAQGRDLPEGVQGELLVQAAGMLSRYFDAPELTRHALTDGWFRTGDLGRRDGAGYYYLTGRAKDLIIRGGANVAPAEVETVLCTHDAVASACVFGMNDEVYGEVPVACIVFRPGASAAEDEIRAHCARKLADFKCPVRVFAVDKMPAGATGKVDKQALMQLAKQKHES